MKEICLKGCSTQEDSKTFLQFISNVFFSMFLSKIKADLSSYIDIDEITFITGCVTHVQGLKCELVLDSHFNTVTITGIGHSLRRSNYFPKAAKLLFKRFVQEVDSQDNDNQNLEEAEFSRVEISPVSPTQVSPSQVSLTPVSPSERQW